MEENARRGKLSKRDQTMSMLYTTEVLEMDERALMKLKTLWSDIKAAVMLGKKDNV